MIERIREPSTWAGLALLLTLAGHPLPVGGVEALQTIGAGVAALLAVIMKERQQ